MDAVAREGEIVAHAISEHVENAGVHSGDATLVLPPQRTYLETIRKVRVISKEIARELEINGPFNMILVYFCSPIFSGHGVGVPARSTCLKLLTFLS